MRIITAGNETLEWTNLFPYWKNANGHVPASVTDSRLQSLLIDMCRRKNAACRDAQHEIEALRKGNVNAEVVINKKRN